MEGARLQAGMGAVSASPGRGPPAAQVPTVPGCGRAAWRYRPGTGITSPGAGPPGLGRRRGLPCGSPDAAAAAAAAAASSSLPPKLVMNVIFSSRPGVGERTGGGIRSWTPRAT